MADTYRRYPNKDIKILWGASAGRCAFPNCRILCIVATTPVDDAAVIGKIAHIHAHSLNGPRSNWNLTPEERDSYGNWILLCSNHHDLVDNQPNTYTVEDLRNWKAEHEAWVHDRLTEVMPNVGFSELEVVAKAIVQTPSDPSTDFKVPDVRNKMKRNNLTEDLDFQITLGLGKSREVQDFVEHVAVRDHRFPERLKAGFVVEYNRMRDDDLEGNSLFYALRDFAFGGSQDFQEQAARLAVLVYLFHKCEVFES